MSVIKNAQVLGTPANGHALQMCVTVLQSGAQGPEASSLVFRWLRSSLQVDQDKPGNSKFEVLDGQHDAVFVPTINELGARLRCEAWLATDVSTKVAMEIGPIALDPTQAERLQEIMLEGKAKFDVTLIEADADEDSSEGSESHGEAAELVLQRRHLAVWVRGECLHYSLVTGKTQLELAAHTADRFTLRGAHSMQLQMAAGTSGARDLALLAFQHLYQDVANISTGGEAVGSPRAGLLRPDQVSSNSLSSNDEEETRRAGATREGLLPEQNKSRSWTKGSNLRATLDAARQLGERREKDAGQGGRGYWQPHMHALYEGGNNEGAAQSPTAFAPSLDEAAPWLAEGRSQQQQPHWSGRQPQQQRQPFGNVLDQFNSKSMSQSWTGHSSQKSGGKGLAAALKAAQSALQTHGLMDDHRVPSDSSINRQVMREFRRSSSLGVAIPDDSWRSSVHSLQSQSVHVEDDLEDISSQSSQGNAEARALAAATQHQLQQSQVQRRVHKAAAAPSLIMVVNCPNCSMGIAGPPDVSTLPCPACNTMVEVLGNCGPDSSKDTDSVPASPSSLIRSRSESSPMQAMGANIHRRAQYNPNVGGATHNPEDNAGNAASDTAHTNNNNNNNNSSSSIAPDHGPAPAGRRNSATMTIPVLEQFPASQDVAQQLQKFTPSESSPSPPSAGGPQDMLQEHGESAPSAQQKKTQVVAGGQANESVDSASVNAPEEAWTEEEDDEVVEAMAKHIGLDLDRWPRLRWIAEECLDLELPKGWQEYEHDKTGCFYYYNHRTGETTWSHPMDAHYRALVQHLCDPSTPDRFSAPEKEARGDKSMLGKETVTTADAGTDAAIGPPFEDQDGSEGEETDDEDEGEHLGAHDSQELDINQFIREKIKVAHERAEMGVVHRFRSAQSASRSYSRKMNPLFNPPAHHSPMVHTSNPLLPPSSPSKITDKPNAFNPMFNAQMPTPSPEVTRGNSGKGSKGLASMNREEAQARMDELAESYTKSVSLRQTFDSGKSGVQVRSSPSVGGGDLNMARGASLDSRDSAQDYDGQDLSSEHGDGFNSNTDNGENESGYSEDEQVMHHHENGVSGTEPTSHAEDVYHTRSSFPVAKNMELSPQPKDVRYSMSTSKGGSRSWKDSMKKKLSKALKGVSGKV